MVAMYHFHGYTRYLLHVHNTNSDCFSIELKLAQLQDGEMHLSLRNEFANANPSILEGLLLSILRKTGDFKAINSLWFERKVPRVSDQGWNSTKIG